MNMTLRGIHDNIVQGPAGSSLKGRMEAYWEFTIRTSLAINKELICTLMHSQTYRGRGKGEGGRG